MKKQWLIIFFIISWMFQAMQIRAQPPHEPGIPFIRNYKSEAYQAHAQNWSIVQDRRGVMYFGNSSRLLKFNGKYWQQINILRNSLIRSLAIDAGQTIYIGGLEEFGYLAITKSGKPVYRSLSDRLPEADKHFGNVWNIYSTSHGVYFLSYKKIFRFYQGKLTAISTSLSYHSAKIRDGVLVITPEGIQVLKNHQLQLLPYTENLTMKTAGNVLCLPYTGNKMLIATLKKGLFIYDLNPLLDDNGAFRDDFTKKQLPPTVIASLDSDIGPFLERYRVYRTAKVNDDCYAFSTLENGIILMNRKGKVRRVIDKGTGLNNNAVLSVYCDRDQNLWAAMNDGIAYIELNSPITLFNEKMGLEGSPLAITRYQGALHVATMSGIYWLPGYQASVRKKKYGFLPVKNADMDCWDFIVHKGILFAGGNHVLYQIKDRIARAQKSSNYIFCFGRSSRFPNHIFMGTRKGLAVLTSNAVQKKTGQQKTFLEISINDAPLKKVKRMIRKIVSDNNGDLWLTTAFNGIIYVRFTGPDISDFEVYHYNKSHGLPKEDWNYVNFFNNRLIISTQRGIYQGAFPDDFAEHPEKMKFMPDNILGKLLPNPERSIGIMLLDSRQHIWCLAGGRMGKFVRGKDHQYIFSDIPFRKIKPSNKMPFIETDGAFWNLKSNNAYRFRENQPKNYQQDYHVMIHSVTVGRDSLLFYGDHGNPAHQADSLFLSTIPDQPESHIPRLSYRDNTIHFKYSGIFYEHAEDNRFQYMLEGFDKDWSLWESAAEKEYTNLPEGDYCFRVRARNIFEHEGREARYRFSIDPPWHRSGFAYTGYGLLLLGLLYLSTWLNSRRLIAAKKRLEKIVTRRTEELREKNEELQEKNAWITQQAAELQERNAHITKQAAELQESKEILQEKNNHIISSIEYAQNIQQAILPLKERLDNSLPKYFILYRPRDIVSGDFYWFHEEDNKVMIAAVDCTGHGVPGAFVSIIGNTLLNEIVNELKERDPARILEYLHLGVRTALKQDQEDSSCRNGMDICLCVFHKNWQKLAFAGAKRPLFIVRHNTEDPENPELLEIKGDRKSIGGFQKEVHRTFTREQIILQPGDSIYLTSDGFVDQNNPEGKKFGSKQLKNLLKNNVHLPVTEQEKRVNAALDQHQGSAEQRDDITVIGIKV